MPADKRLLSGSDQLTAPPQDAGTQSRLYARSRLPLLQISKMASEDRCSTHKNKLGDFPPRDLLDVVISSFPKAWRGIFAALNSEHLAVQVASFWLQEKSAKDRLLDIPPNFTDLIDHLLSDFPVVLNEKLFLKPKILLLPLNIQRNILALISYHSGSVPMECLEKLVVCLSKFSLELDGWRLTHLKIIESKARDLKAATSGGSQDKEQSKDRGHDLHYTGLITEASKARFEGLVEKAKLGESSRKIPWFGSVFISEMQGDNFNRNSLEQCAPSEGFGGKDDGPDDIKMVDLIDTCTQDAPVQSEKTMQVIHPGSPEVLDDSDIEIMEVVRNPAREIRLEHNIDIMKGLTVPQPPEGLIIDDEDVLEPSVINTKGVPEHLITEEEVTADCKLSNTLQQKVSALKELLQSLDSYENNFSNALEVFSSCSSLEMESICAQLNLKDIRESAAISLCQQFVSLPTEPSFGNASVFAIHCLLPKVQGLKQTASRDLFSAVSLFAKKYSRAFCDGVVVSLIQRSNLDSPQVALVNKIVKECLSEDTRVYLLQLIISIKSETKGCSFLWTEDTASVVQTLVDLKPELRDDLFVTLVSVLERQSRHLSKSLKYAKMLLAVIKSYAQQVSQHLDYFVRSLEGNETFLKKAGLAALKKNTKN